MFSSISIIALLIISSLTTLSTHPLTMAGLLIVFALIAAIFSFKLLSSWFFYMLALVFLGGVIVVLSFIVSLCRNEQFSPQTNWNLIVGPLLTLPFFLANPTPTLIVNHRDNQIIITLYQNDRRGCFVFIIITLVTCIISAVSLRKIERGPLVKRL